MTRVLLSPGMPLAEVRRQLRRSRQLTPLPTGDAVTTASTHWQASVVAHATPHTKGSWVELVAATTLDLYGIIVSLGTNIGANATDTSLLVDIGTGPSLSEVVAIPNLAMGYRGIVASTFTTEMYRFPIFIPAGTRIAARSQSAVTVKAATISLGPMARTTSPSRPSPKIIDMGTNLATSAGVALANTTAAHTKAGWTEIIAATAEAYTGIVIGLQGGGDTVFTTGSGLLDVAVGAAGAEAVIVPNVLFTVNGSSEVIQLVNPGPYAVDIAAGSRLAVRIQDAAAAAANLHDVILYGIR